MLWKLVSRLWKKIRQCRFVFSPTLPEPRLRFWKISAPASSGVGRPSVIFLEFLPTRMRSFDQQSGPTGGVNFFLGKIGFSGGEFFSRELPGDGRTSGLSDRKRRAPS